MLHLDTSFECCVCCSVLHLAAVLSEFRLCCYRHNIRCVAVCNSVLQCVAVCCSVLHCCQSFLHVTTATISDVLQCVAVCCSLLHRCQSFNHVTTATRSYTCRSAPYTTSNWAETCCSVLQSVAVEYEVPPYYRPHNIRCVSVCCSVLQSAYTGAYVEFPTVW